MKDVLLLEAPDGFIVQGLVVSGASTGTWSDTMGTQVKETLTFLDDDIARFMEEASARRGQPNPSTGPAGHYETAFRVIGRYMDDQKPRDVFFFEQDGAFVVAAADERPGRQPPPPRRVHPRRHQRHGRPRSEPAARGGQARRPRPTPSDAKK